MGAADTSLSVTLTYWGQPDRRFTFGWLFGSRGPMFLNIMTCCPEIIVPFNGVSETVVPYAGTSPLIQIVYSVGGQLIAQGVFTNWTLSAGEITFDHGGVASGFIKIS